MRSRREYLAAVGAAAGALAGCTTGSAVETEYDVGMASNQFRPEVVEVEAGETVVWANTGSRNHTVTAYEDGIPEAAAYFASGGYESEQEARDAWLNGPLGGAINAGETYRHTFEVPGEYQYLCVPHEASGMVGTVRVR